MDHGRLAMLRFGLAAVVGAAALNPAPAPAGSRPDRLIAEWTQQNTLCRGGSGDDPRTQAACDRREALGKEIDKAGWCYGKKDQYGYQFAWHACVADSLHLS